MCDDSKHSRRYDGGSELEMVDDLGSARSQWEMDTCQPTNHCLLLWLFSCYWQEAINRSREGWPFFVFSICCKKRGESRFFAAKGVCCCCYKGCCDRSDGSPLFSFIPSMPSGGSSTGSMVVKDAPQILL